MLKQMADNGENVCQFEIQGAERDAAGKIRKMILAFEIRLMEAQ